jgi:hypothetical protein
MNPAEIDRIVREDEVVEPSPRFTARVMCSVRAAVAERQTRRSPWLQAWPGLALVSVLIPVVIAARVLGAAPGADSQAAEAMLWLSLTIVLTLTLASWSTGLGTRR